MMVGEAVTELGSLISMGMKAGLNFLKPGGHNYNNNQPHQWGNQGTLPIGTCGDG